MFSSLSKAISSPGIPLGITASTATPGSLAEFCGEGSAFIIFRGGKLSPCFVHLFLFGPLFLFFIICGSFRLKQVVALPMPAPRPLSRQQAFKLVLTGLIAGYNLVLFAVLSAFDFGRPYQWLMYPIACLTWLYCVIVLIAEAKYGLPTNWVLRTFWVSSFLIATLELWANITTDQAQNTPYFAAFLIHYVLFLSAAVAGMVLKETHTIYAQLPLDFSEITFDDDHLGNPDREIGEPGERSAAKVFPLEKGPLRRMVMLFRREKVYVAGGLACCLIGAPIEVIQFIYIGLILDDIAVPEGPTVFPQYVSILVLLYVIEAVMSGFQLVLFNIAGERMACRLRRTIFNAVLRQEVGYLEGTSKAGEIIKCLSEDVSRVQDAQTSQLATWLQSMIQILVGTAFVFVLSWKLSLVGLAITPFIALMMLAQATVMQSFTKRTQDAMCRVEEISIEIINNIRTVRTFARENKEKSRFGSEVVEANRQGKRMAVAHASSEGLGVFVLKMSAILAIFYGGSLVHHHELSGGTLVSFVFISLQVVMAFSVVPPLLGSISQSVKSAAKIFEILDREPEINIRGGLTLPKIEGRLEFKNVSFAYPSQPDVKILRNLNLKIEGGHTVAICGPPRSGKTTILSLCERLYDPTDGLVLLDDTDISSFDPQWLRQQIAFVPQEPVLFSTYTIAENISYGSDARQEQIQAVAEKVDLHDTLHKLPHGGYRAIVGGKNFKLSNGEKQRIGIARAMLRDPKIILLDEVSSGLDENSEVLVQQALSRATQGRTVVTVAHKLQSIRNADLIVFVKDGAVIEAGDHSFLMSNPDGNYRRMWERQVPLESGDWEEEDELSGRIPSAKSSAPVPFLSGSKPSAMRSISLASSKRSSQLIDDLDREIRQIAAERGSEAVSKLTLKLQQLKNIL